MIGAVNLAVAVSAVHPDLEASTARISIIEIQEVPDMSAAASCPDICMALLAQLRPLLVQQRLVVRTMDPMAQGTVFAYRRMLPQVRAALFGMAGITGIVGTRLDQ